MSKAKKEMLWVWVMLAMFSGSMLMHFFSEYVLKQTPYRDVEVVRITRAGDDVWFIANFEKKGCEFQRLRVVGSSLGETQFIDWRDLDGIPQDEDRGEGEQTLRLSLSAPENTFDWIEIRTRHDCDGDIVDRIFARIQPVP